MRSTVDAGMLRKVLDNVQRGVLRLSYYTPWDDRHEQHVTHGNDSRAASRVT